MPRRKDKKADGSGLFEMFSPRTDYNNVSRRTLEQFGAAQITGITLSRAPIRRFLRRALDMITAGRFEQAIRRFGYDRLFHLSAIVDVLTSEGIQRRIVVEKNAVVNISTAYINEPDAEFLTIHIRPGLTLESLMSNTQTAMGANFFPYDPWANNCQHFIQAMLAANGLLTDRTNKWLFQDMSQVQAALPGVSKVITKGITHMGAVADRILGRGLSDADLEVVLAAIVSELERKSRHKA